LKKEGKRGPKYTQQKEGQPIGPEGPPKKPGGEPRNGVFSNKNELKAKDEEKEKGPRKKRGR